MFGRRAHAVRPLPMTATYPPGAIELYEQRATQMEFAPAQLLEQKLLRFLAAEGIKVFNYSEVDKYLQRKTPRRKVWIWRPLRPKDVLRLNWDGSDNYAYGPGSYRVDEWDYRPYDKIVPMHALQKVSKIEERFPKSLHFFVSDYKDVKPDPFIMVTALDVKNIIFDVWDEPDFGQITEE